MFSFYKYLNGASCYYSTDNQNNFYQSPTEVIKSNPNTEYILDLAGVVEIFMKTWLFDCRTLVENIKLSPWLAERKNNEWSYFELPKHSNVKDSYDYITDNLIELLTKEMLGYIDKEKNVGILLSGGLDSRIAAAILNKIKSSHIWTGNVVGITWGNSGSRDVIYAQNICKILKWDWVHLPITIETFYNNIFVSADYGAEISALHYHGIPDILKIKNVDCIIGASYGDSVGRAEFSGKHITKLPYYIDFSKLNPYGLLKNNLIFENLSNVLSDAFDYKKRNNSGDLYSQREIELELHYMRRKLTNTFQIIKKEKSFYQMFTAPEVYGYMWSLDKYLRNDNIYKIVLAKLSQDLYNIPWARTGASIGKKTAQDNYTRHHTEYRTWIRHELKDMILQNATSKNILGAGFLNFESFERNIENWERSNTLSTNYFDEILVWLASLSIFIDKYKIIPKYQYKTNISDRISALLGTVHGKMYISARNLLRK